jgi:hypothetical protein
MRVFRMCSSLLLSILSCSAMAAQTAGPSVQDNETDIRRELGV